MLNNTIDFTAPFLLPYTGEHKVGYWPELMHDTSVVWEKI